MSFWQGFSSKVKNIAQNVAKKSSDKDKFEYQYGRRKY